MQTKGEYLIAAPRDAVWAALNDPAVLQQCIPGCESFSAAEGGRFEALVAASVGPVRASFKTSIALEELEPPQRYSLVGEGRSGAAGFAKGRADVHLVAEGEKTRLHYSTTFQVGGRLAQVGSRLVVAATRKTTDEFFAAFTRHLEYGTTPADARMTAAAPTFNWRMLAAVAAALLVAGILLWTVL